MSHVPNQTGELRESDVPIAFVVSKRPNPSHHGYEVWTIRCPWCGYLHEHGGREGHRVAHCSDKRNPGYYIMDRPETEASRSC